MIAEPAPFRAAIHDRRIERDGELRPIFATTGVVNAA
jgi:hypothetical protein